MRYSIFCYFFLSYIKDTTSNRSRDLLQIIKINLYSLSTCSLSFSFLGFEKGKCNLIRRILKQAFPCVYMFELSTLACKGAFINDFTRVEGRAGG